MIIRSNIKSRKRLDDISEDLSSIPSYDGAGRNERQVEEDDDDQMIFDNMHDEQEKDDLNESER